MRHRIASKLRTGLVVFTAPFLAALVSAQTVTVDLGRDDVVDFGGAQRVADLPGPDGHVSLREAVTATNNTPGPQTIVFAIPTSEWWLYTDLALIRLENMLYVSDDETTLDFTTQTAFTGNTNELGGEVGLYYAGPPSAIPGLWLAADDCVVRGLDVSLGNNFGNGMWLSGNRNRVLGCTTTGLLIRGDYGGGAFNVVGGTAPGEGNRFSEGVDVLSRANDNVFVGNTFRWGLRISGDTFWGPCERNRVGGASAAERNVLAGHGRYGEEGLPLGNQLEIFHARDTLVQGNYVGTTADGLAKHPGNSGTGGIVVGLGAQRTLVLDNLVSGIAMAGTNHYQGQRFGTGIAVIASASATELRGNRVGLAADGATPIPNVSGILVQTDPNGSPAEVTVRENHVAFQETSGVRVGFDTGGVSIRRNALHDNGALGIDLVAFGGAGVSANDALDLDEGGNHLQNFPVLARALSAGAGMIVSGELASEPGRDYALDFYASPTRDPSGHGEGARFVGSLALTTDAQGRARFASGLHGGVPAGWWLTATATDVARGETSEFSAARPIARVLGVR